MLIKILFLDQGAWWFMNVYQIVYMELSASLYVLYTLTYLINHIFVYNSTHIYHICVSAK